jgi:glycosyltransferase involved in cell wall biosynthesis
MFMSILTHEIETQPGSVLNVRQLGVALLTGGIDRPYAYGLALALNRKGVCLDVIGNSSVDSPAFHTTPNLQFIDLWPHPRRKANRFGKCVGLAQHYLLLFRYAALTQRHLFHILWNSKVQLFDRTLLMLYYKALGKRITLTAHNVNQAKRDAKDSYLNRLTLKIQYHLSDHIFVHTQKMKSELVGDFRVAEGRVTVLRYPLDDAFPHTDLTVADARWRLGIRDEEKVILCFGRIKPYKGIEYLLAAFRQLTANGQRYRLIVAGEVQKGNETYLRTLEQSVAEELERGMIIFKAQFIPDEEIEAYFKAADVLVLPYVDIFQSGVLFLGYSFGLPVIATDVGSFREEIVEGETGYVCRAADPTDLAGTIETYFGSDLYSDSHRRQKIRRHAEIHHSWEAVADLTRNVYAGLLRSTPE